MFFGSLFFGRRLGGALVVFSFAWFRRLWGASSVAGSYDERADQKDESADAGDEQGNQWNSQPGQAFLRRLPIADGKHQPPDDPDRAGQAGPLIPDQDREQPERRQEQRELLERIVVSAEIAFEFGMAACLWRADIMYPAAPRNLSPEPENHQHAEERYQRRPRICKVHRSSPQNRLRSSYSPIRSGKGGGSRSESRNWTLVFCPNTPRT